MSDDYPPMTHFGALRAAIKQAVMDVREQTPLAQSFTNSQPSIWWPTRSLRRRHRGHELSADDAIATAEGRFLIGTTSTWARCCRSSDALPEIARKLHENGKMRVLDPVAVGIGETRTFILESFRDAPPTIVRGNA